MLWFAMQFPIPPAVSGTATVLPILALAVAAVPIGVVVYKTFTRHLAYRPALRVVEGGRRELTLKPA